MSFSFSTLLNPASLFAIRGGVHPETRKFLAASCAIEDMPIPALIRVPLRQHIGAQAEPFVARDDLVEKGQLIARARGPVSANVHAPTSGRVIAVGHFTAPHPSGLPVPTITIRPDGEDRWGPRLSRIHPETAAPEEIAAQKGPPKLIEVCVAACALFGERGVVYQPGRLTECVETSAPQVETLQMLMGKEKTDQLMDDVISCLQTTPVQSGLSMRPEDDSGLVLLNQCMAQVIQSVAAP